MMRSRPSSTYKDNRPWTLRSIFPETSLNKKKMRQEKSQEKSPEKIDEKIDEKNDERTDEKTDEKTDERTDEKTNEKTDDKKEEESERVYPGWNIKIPVMFSLYVIMSVVALDGTIIATAVPSITNQFHSISDVGWYGSIYMMMRCAFVLVFGKLYTFFNPKHILLAATMLFVFGSSLCGAAPSSAFLIVGRAIAGLGAAGINTGTSVSIKHLFPLEKRPMAMSFLSLTYTLPMVFGPLIGGIITDRLSWRWNFYINIPIGCTGILLLSLFLNLPSARPSKGPMTLKQQFLKLDPLGFVTFIPSVILLMLALEWGGIKYAWSDPIMIGLTTVIALFFVAFVSTQLWLEENATVPPRIAKQRSIACGCWYTLMTAAAIAVVVNNLPLWFQAVRGVSAMESGLEVIPNAVSTAVASISSGIVILWIGYYVPLMISGPIFMATGSGLLTTLTPTTPMLYRILYQIVYGIGAGGCGQQAVLAAQTVLDDKDIAIGIAIMMFGQNLGSALFISVGQNVFVTRLVEDLRNVPGFSDQRVLEGGVTELRKDLSGAALEIVVNAYNDALTRVFFVTMILACLALLGTAGMEWKSVKKNKKNKKSNV